MAILNSPKLLSMIQPGEEQGIKVDTLLLQSPQEGMAYHLALGGENLNSIDPEKLGLANQTAMQFLEEGYSKESLRLFSEAQAKLAPAPTLGRNYLPAAAGGAWVLPLVLQNSPLPARLKIRDKLPPRIIKMRIRASWDTTAESLARPAAMVARALWDYQLAGGIVQFSVVHTLEYKQKSTRGTRGLVIETQIPLTSEASITLACSPAYYRAISMGFGCELSPIGFNESFPRNVWLERIPEYLNIFGDRGDNTELARFNIQA